MGSPLIAQVKQEEESTRSHAVVPHAVSPLPQSPGSVLDSVTRKVNRLRVEGTPVGGHGAVTAAPATTPSTSRLPAPPTILVTTPSGVHASSVPMDVSPSVSAHEDRGLSPSPSGDVAGISQSTPNPADSDGNPAPSLALFSQECDGDPEALADAERNLDEDADLETQLLELSSNSKAPESDYEDSLDSYSGSDKASHSDSGEDTVVEEQEHPD